MDPGCLDHCLTSEEAARFQDEGYLVLPDALSREQVEAVRGALERFEATTPPNKTSSYYNYADILGIDAAFVDLIDAPRVFPKVFGLLGFNIQINHSHINEDRPDPADVAFAWHRDGAIATWDLPPPIPLLGLKLGFYVTDVSRDDASNTFVIPGSHRDQARPLPKHGSRTDDCVPVLGGPGTVMLMDPRIIHCRGPNHSDATRKVVFVQYAFRWLRPLDAMRVEGLRDRISDPIRRQLLGLDVRENQARRLGTWYPTAADLPLWSWLVEHLGERAESCVGLAASLPKGWSARALPTKPSQY